MRLSRLVGQRLKETPRDAEAPSHIFLIRGGYARAVSTGIYSLLPLARRITAKIEQIIREEMNAIEGQEVLMPVVLPADLWEESGRWQSVGPELLRFTDRNGKNMLLGMTHEEAVVHLARTELTSHKQLPVMLYQIQTKYRDEARARGGLIRVREFTMKDGYSFHTSWDCLKAYYERCHGAYVRIFQRIGLTDVVSIESDPGMMGGNVSHEFMAIADCGEDTIFMSPDGEYRANREVAVSPFKHRQEEPEELTRVHTPGRQTIEEVSSFLGVPQDRLGKVVFYSLPDDTLAFVVIRGDLEVNETKLRNHLKVTELLYATDEQISRVGAVPGYASPMGINTDRVRIIFDPTARNAPNLVVGANEDGFHLRGFNFGRDMGASAAVVEVTDIATVRAGDPCPVTGAPLLMKKGIEVGNIFQLGVKYSESMGCCYLDASGSREPMIMGCYGIGVGRAMAAVVEQSHDKYGPIWPMSIAPFHVHIIALNPSQSDVRAQADELYREFLDAGVEVLYDDRGEKAGSAFNDADLIGIPVRIVVSPKTVDAGKAELSRRGNREKEMLDIGTVVGTVAAAIRAELQEGRKRG